MLQSWSKRLMWVALTGVIALFATEVFTRVLMPQNRDTLLAIVEADETVGYIYQANVKAMERGREYDVPYEISSDGLRDREYSETDSDHFRVLLIGNSYCVSHGLEIQDSMSRALERELQAKLSSSGDNRTVQVINTSNAGYNAYNYWKSYARWAPVFKPDAVIVGFVAAREHLSDHDDVRFVVQNGFMQARYRKGENPVIPRQSPLRIIRKGLARNSDLYVLLRNYFYYNERISKFLSDKGSVKKSSRLTDPFLKKPTPQVIEGRQLALDYMDRLRDETTNDGVALLVMGIPGVYEVLDKSWEKARLRAEELDVAVEQSLPMRELTDHCKTSNIAVIDLVPTLRSIGAKGYFVYDKHWNKEGIAAAAKAVANNWSKLGMP